MPDRQSISPNVAVPRDLSATYKPSVHSDCSLGNRQSLYCRVGKRLVDVSLSLVGLISLAPILVIIGVLVRLSSRGPVLFRQHRVGKDGKLFRVLKFRSMVDGANRMGNGITPDNDPRVTPLGTFLRKWKLDELPQLWNVMIGEMSLVGPRPELASYVAGYTSEQKRVLEVRPGITDPASLKYRDEGCVLQRSADPELLYRERILPEKLSLNLLYLKDISFAYDLSLMLSTIKSVVRFSQTRERD